MIWENSQEHYMNVFKKYNVKDEQDINNCLKFLKLKSKQDIQDLAVVGKKIFQQFWKQLTSPPRILLFPRNPCDPSINSQKKIRAIIMGKCGNGKSSLLNNVCGSKLQTGEGMLSMTRNLSQFPSKFINNFSIVDTPGTNSQTDEYQHAYHLKAALQWGEYNAIFIQADFQTRGQNTIADLKRAYKMVEPFQKNIIFLISNIDRSENPKEMAESICQCLKQAKLNQQVICYSNKQVYPKVLAKLLFQNACQLPSIKISIDQMHFLKTFHLQKSLDVLKEEKQNAISEMEQQTNLYIKTANQLLKFPAVSQYHKYILMQRPQIYED